MTGEFKAPDNDEQSIPSETKKTALIFLGYE